MKAVIFKEATVVPTSGGMQLFNPAYRDMKLEDIRKESRIDSEYVPYGYNYFVFVRDTGTIYAHRLHG